MDPLVKETTEYITLHLGGGGEKAFQSVSQFF